ncbi:hydroxypyruvate isomerase family protein [Compostibacter hankyongensis]|uniref:TIM barrel protein n=1 Tax=Compostibacter hankyongensis TaxID=1007089 RepID=A0ABP8FBR5_9BACT
MAPDISRRRAVKNILGGGAVLGMAPSALLTLHTKTATPMSALKNNIRQSACYWCYQSIPLDDFCAALKKMGLPAVDLLGPKEWDTAKKYGLDVGMCYGGDLGIPKGWNDPQYWDTMLKNYAEALPLAAQYGYKNIICFSGNRKGMDDETGLKNCTEGLKKLMPLAERYKVNVVMELLNSKVNHHDYMCDHTLWGVELCKRIGSDRFKLLYDIYHMQIMEGDVIHTIKDYHPYIAHYHTGGVPGRHELNETQELYYPAIMKAILDTGYQGYVAQEFVPSPKDNAAKLESLAQCVKVCDV